MQNTAPNLKTNMPLITSIVSTVLLILDIVCLVALASEGLNSTDSATAVGTGIGIMLVIPHFLVFAVGVLLAWIATGTKSKGCMLTAAILFSVAVLIGIGYFMFPIPSVVLGFIAYAKLNKAAKVEEDIRRFQQMKAAAAAMQAQQPTSAE